MVITYSENVGYLTSGFEYFLEGFTHEVDQVKQTVHQDRIWWALPRAWIRFCIWPSYDTKKTESTAKKPSKCSKFSQNPIWFAQKVDQQTQVMDQDRSQWALSKSIIGPLFRRIGPSFSQFYRCFGGISAFSQERGIPGGNN